MELSAVLVESGGSRDKTHAFITETVTIYIFQHLLGGFGGGGDGTAVRLPGVLRIWFLITIIFFKNQVVNALR